MVSATIDRSSVTASRSDITALEMARNKQELSSGMILSSIVPPTSGTKTSGGSDISKFCFRDSDRGAGGSVRGFDFEEAEGFTETGFEAD